MFIIKWLILRYMVHLNRDKSDPKGLEAGCGSDYSFLTNGMGGVLQQYLVMNTSRSNFPCYNKSV